MIDPRIWDVLREDFTVAQVYEIREAIEAAEQLGGRRVDIVPQTLFDHEHCTVCASFYSKELAEHWVTLVGRTGTGPHISRIKDGFRMCIDFEVFKNNPFWPGW